MSVSYAAQQELAEFMDKGQGLAVLVGRKGVGKTHAIQNHSQSHCFYFCSRHKENAQTMKSRLAAEWASFSGDNQLRFRASHYLSWFDILKEFENWATHKKLCLVLDDAHWIAGPRTGFLEEFVSFWKSWKENSNISVILSTSSSRFLDRQVMTVGGEFSKYLRIDLRPMQVHEVAENFLPNWTPREICLTYLMTGGIPRYLEKIDPKETFVAAMQKVFFTTNWVADEVEQVLGLHFSKRGLPSVLKILKTMAPCGVLQSSIAEKSGVPQSSVSEILTRLLDFGLVYRALPASQEPRRNDVGYLYLLNDRFLCFWLQFLEGWHQQDDERRKNFADMLLEPRENSVLQAYFQEALERLVQEVLTGRAEAASEFYKVAGVDRTQTVLSSEKYITSQNVQSLWEAAEGFQWDSLGEARGSRTLVLSNPWTSSFAQKAKEEGVRLIGFEQLVGNSSVYSRSFS